VFNALRYIKNLEATGIPRNQAEAQVQLVLDAIEGEVATKTEFSEFRAEVKKDLAEVRTDMVRLENRLILKLGGLVLTCMTLQIGVIGFLIHLK